MNNNFKTVPNQKVVKVKKELCDNQHYYTMINLQALDKAAQTLKSGAFKLWIYFAKNQNNYTFALSSKEVCESFGIKIKQYNSAIQELIENNYLVQQKGNNYIFNENPNSVIPKQDNEDMPNQDKLLSQKDIRNNTENTNNNTKQKEFIF